MWGGSAALRGGGHRGGVLDALQAQMSCVPALHPAHYTLSQAGGANAAVLGLSLEARTDYMTPALYGWG